MRRVRQAITAITCGLGLALVVCLSMAQAKITTTGGYIDASGTARGTIVVPAGYCYYMSGRAWVCGTADGKIVLYNSGQSGFGLLQLGGTTASFPAIKVNGTGLDFRLADDSGYASVTASAASVTSIKMGAGGPALFSSTSPTISSGFGTSPSIAASNGTAAFSVNVGTGGTATSGVIGLPFSTATGWNCTCSDVTTASTTVFLCKQTAAATLTATIGNFNTAGAAAAWVASDILSVSCFAR